MGGGDALGVEVFIEGFESLEGDLWVRGGSGGGEQARAEFGWVLGGCCTMKAVVNDILGTEKPVSQIVSETGHPRIKLTRKYCPLVVTQSLQ